VDRKSLKISLDELCSAMENSSYENEYYLDLKTGEILFLSEYMDDEETSKLRERMEQRALEWLDDIEVTLSEG